MKKSGLNEYVDCGDYYEIKLCDKEGNYIASAKIDSEDVAKCKPYKWYQHTDGHVCANIGFSRIYLHHLVLDLIDPSLLRDAQMQEDILSN